MNNIVRISIFSPNFSFSFVLIYNSYTCIHLHVGILGYYAKVYFFLWVEVRHIERIPTSYHVQEAARYILDWRPPNLCFSTALVQRSSLPRQLASLLTVPNCRQRVFLKMCSHQLLSKEPLGLLVQYGNHRRCLHHLHLTHRPHLI